ncbi:histidine kinase [Paenibacillus sp. J5C_2022]|uniref:cache domain-containing sensor histidine kinase n=1 Tax=Paenibacillus sp. J5C2022 TaxID=2977129 RepID=UPI0021CEB6C2|nr:sensor histidine kinase [Paenibacillus sp. J5C2022]MCU6712698.1 histidine kinase [Paenibacillus sp. J5C2022]
MFRSTYYRKIQLSFIMLILLPIITVSIISYVLNKKSNMDNIELTNKSILQLMEKEITETINDLSYASLIFTENDLLKPYYKHYATLGSINSYQDYTTYSGIESLLTLVSFEATLDHIHLFVANEQGLIISTPGFFGMGNDMVQLEKHWREIRAKESFTTLGHHFQWLGAVSAEGNPEKYFYGSRIITDPSTGRLLAVLNIGISEKYFTALFEPVERGKFALFDSEGNLFAGSEDVLLTRQDDEATIRDSAVIPIVNWTLVFETSKHDVVGQLNKTFYVSGIIVAVSMILFLLLSMLVAKTLHKPIHKLQRIASQFGGGNRSMRFLVTGNDEMNHLGRTINDMLDQIEALIADIRAEQDEKRRMELHTLANQIRPHFLLNTLNAIKISLIMNKDAAHSEKVNSLMTLLRNYLKLEEPSLLSEECEILCHYVSLMEMRSDMSIEWRADFSDEAGRCQIPKLLLQPIVENAIVHGFVEREIKPVITLQARISNGKLEIAVSDNGVGMTELEMTVMNRKLLEAELPDSADPDHIGLNNILKRMKLLYGSEAGMHIVANADAGITVMLSFPVIHSVTDKEW